MATGLHTAVESGCLEEVRRLLEIEGKNIVNAEDPRSKETPLHAAARLGNADIVRELLEAGAGITAFGHASVVEILLAAAENKNLETDRGSHPLDFAAVYGHLDILNLLLARHPMDTFDKTHALCLALHCGQVRCARSLISVGAETNQFLTRYGAHIACPLYFALDAIKPLPMNCRQEDSPSTAVKTNEMVLKLVHMLVEDGADVNVICSISLDYGRFNMSFEANILSCAARNYRFEAIKYLLAKGADVGTKFECGWGVLHFAVASGRPDTVDLLLNAGASDQISWKIFMPETNRKEWTALDIIGSCDDRLRHYSENNDSLASDYAEIVNKLVENGADVEAKDEFGNTALHSACLIGDFTTAAGCCIGEEWEYEFYSDDRISYHMQPVRRLLPLISAFLQAGANANALNKKMQTPLHCLLMDAMSVIGEFSSIDDDWNEERKRPPIKEFLKTLCSTIQVLVEAGANLNQRNLKGCQPLHDLVHGFDEYYLKKNEEVSNEDHDSDVESLSFSPQHEIDSVIVQLLQCGARSWEVVPEPCFGAEKALFDVWKGGDNMDLRLLFEKLEDRLKPRLQMCLLVLNRLLPGRTELHLQILAEAL